jgi:hypothetical protein
MKLGVKSLSDLLKLESFMLFLVGISLFGLVIIFVYALVLPHSWYDKASILGVSIFIAIATFLSGLFLGFIFGIPRTTETQNLEPGKTPEKPTEIPMYLENKNRLYTENSNLERISDWLTTGIVTIALVSLKQVPEALQQFSGYVGPALNATTAGGAASTSGGIYGTFILICYSIDGFLIGYLGTRRRAAVDFGKGIFEEEEIIESIKTLLNPAASKEEKEIVKRDIRRFLRISPVSPKQQENNSDSESPDSPSTKQKDET